MSTIHNPVNFQPENYKVIDYLDNKEPEYHFGEDMGFFRARVAQWKKEWDAYFPDGVQHKCKHCGNGRIRVVAVCLYSVSKEFVAFGKDCVERLEFANQVEFKAGLLAQKIAGGKERLRISKLVEALLIARPDIKAVVDVVKNDAVQADNDFAQDVVRKLFQYGSLSENQVKYLLDSPAKHAEIKRSKAEKQANIPDWVAGDQVVVGKIIGEKFEDNAFGGALRALIELQDGRKCYGTYSTKFPEKGLQVSFRADIKVSDRDSKFAFFKRPKEIKAV